MNSSGLCPVEFQVVIEIDPVREKTAGGLYLPNSVQAADKLSTQEGTLVAVSPAAFDYAVWPEGSRKPQVGDRVLFKRYDGFMHERGGRDFRLMPDKSVVAIIEAEKVDDSGYSEAPGGAWIRCMGGRFCDHAPKTCTASPEYQAAIVAQRNERAA